MPPPDYRTGGVPSDQAAVGIAIAAALVPRCLDTYSVLRDFVWRGDKAQDDPTKNSTTELIQEPETPQLAEEIS